MTKILTGITVALTVAAATATAIILTVDRKDKADALSSDDLMNEDMVITPIQVGTTEENSLFATTNLAACAAGYTETSQNGDKVSNQGQKCYKKCNDKQGPCPSYCGSAGTCCRLGYKDKSNGCDGTLGTDKWNHTCVINPATASDNGKQCIKTVNHSSSPKPAANELILFKDKSCTGSGISIRINLATYASSKDLPLSEEYFK